MGGGGYAVVEECEGVTPMGAAPLPLPLRPCRLLPACPA